MSPQLPAAISRMGDGSGAVILKLACASLVACVAPAALAHHVAGFAKPTSIGMGLLSGLGHPVIGLGSLVFLLAIGLWCAHAKSREPRDAGRGPGNFTLPVLLAGTAAGGILDAAGFVLPADDLLIAISVIAAGVLLLATWRRMSSPSILSATVAIGVAAVVHGMVAAEGSAGADGAPRWAYWAGILLTQVVLWFVAYRAGAAVVANSPVVAQRGYAIGGAAVLLAGAALIAYPGLTLLR